MSKRSRGSRRANQRRPGGRPPGRPARQVQNRPSGRSEPRRTDVVELDEELDELDSTESDEPVRQRERTVVATNVTARTRARPSSALAARAASEYVYVAQDVRRIAIVATILFAVLLVLWVLIVATRILPI